MTTLVEQTHFCWVKSLMGVKFPLVSTPLPLDSDDDDDDPKLFFKLAKTRVFSKWWIIFSFYPIKKIIDKGSMG